MDKAENLALVRHNLFSLVLKFPQLIEVGVDCVFFGGLQLRFLIAVFENQ